MTKVYHGSGQKFSKFDYAKIGEHGTSEGYGFYFTGDESIARGYATNSGSGYLYTVNFKGVKPMSDSKRTIKRTDFIRFIRALGVDFLANYGDLKTCIESEFDTAESDTEMIAGIINGYGNREFVLNKLHEILGYDSIIQDCPTWGIGQTVFIAMVESAYEITSIEKVEAKNG